MKNILIAAGIFLVVVFFAVYGYNTTQPEPLNLLPPYAYQAGDMASEAYSLLFVFATSLLFFGFSTPIALGIESAKTASLISTHAVSMAHALFLIPAFLVAVAATYLGQGLLRDYRGEGLWQDYAQKSAVYLGASLLVWLFIFIGQGLLSTLVK